MPLITNNISSIKTVGLSSVAATYRVPRFIVYWRGKTYDNAPADYDGSGFVGTYLLSKSTNRDREDSVSGYYFILHPDVPNPYSYEKWGCYWAEVVTQCRILPVGTPAFRVDIDGNKIIAVSQERLSDTLGHIGIGLERVGQMRVRNADMAHEMTKYTHGSILQQASQAMLAQANGNNNGVLKLLDDVNDSDDDTSEGGELHLLP